jgi:hypothetical protein
MKRLYLYAITTVCITGLCAQEFVVKKKKRVSTSRLKEQIGEAYEDIAKLSSSIICSLSHLNPALVDRTKELINGEINSQAHDLEKHLSALQNMKSKLIVHEKEINEMLPLLEQKL